MQRTRTLGGLALVALVGIGTSAPPLSADVRVEVEGQLVNTYASGAPIDLTTAQLAAVAGFEGYDFIRIYDENTIGGAVPTADIGAVTITLSSTTTALNPELRVLIASPSEPDFAGSAADPTLLLLAGARDFRSLTIAAESNPFYTLDDLRDSIRLAAAVTRNVGSPTANPRDRIEVGQVFRLQAIAGGTAGPLSQANIHADVSAYVHDFHHGGLKAIEYVTASNSIAGTIEAVGDLPIGQTPSPSSNYSSIEKIVVGANNDQAAGISGDILARLGSIGFIYSTGPIGIAGQGGESLIEAGDDIREIRIVDETDTIDPDSGRLPVLNRNIYANIQSNLLLVRDEYDHQGYDKDGVIHLIETGGALSGFVKAGNIALDPANRATCRNLGPRRH